MKYVYVVRGSEDGNIGVYTSLRKAFDRAVEYANIDWDYNNFKKEMKEYSGRALLHNSWLSVEVERFITNS